MTDMKKPDLSRINAELAYERRQTAHLQTVIDRLNAENRALLDAKEAREAECRAASDLIQSLKSKVSQQDAQLTEARAAKEAAERQTAEAYRLLGNADKRQHQTDLELTEARASAAAAYGEGYRDCAYGERSHHHSSTEALRRVKEAVWEDAYKRGLLSFGADNPYRQPKDAAHD